MGKYVKQSFILFAIMSFMLFGCGGTQAEDAQNSELQESEVVNDVEVAVKESPAEEETEETEESDGITESFETEEQNQAPTQMVDWETFATQADSDDICLAISNEDRGYQQLITIPEGENNTVYEPKEGDRFAVPVRDNIIWINVVTIKNLEIINNERLYLKDDSTQSPGFFELSFEKGNNYNVLIEIEESQEAFQFFIQNE